MFQNRVGCLAEYLDLRENVMYIPYTAIYNAQPNCGEINVQCRIYLLHGAGHYLKS
jgi:hypothetical protein